jgi:hypothetical protein
MIPPPLSRGWRNINLARRFTFNCGWGILDEVATGYNLLRIEYAGAWAEMEVRVLGRRQAEE